MENKTSGEEKETKLKRYCKKPGCNCLIEYKEKYCEKHKKEQGETEKERHKYYDTHKRNIGAKKFYNSAAWRGVREQALIRDNYIDRYLFEEKGVIKTADTVHHIIELQEDYEKGLDLDNLISVSDDTHAKISQIYKNPEKRKELQEKLKYFIEKNKLEIEF